MESENIYGLVGGIANIVLHPATTPLPELGGDEGMPVALYDRGSSYVEEQILESGLYRVRHTLSFVTKHGDSPFTNPQMLRALRDGVVADVTLASGAQIRVGWSERLGVHAPLRLQQVEFTSGERGTDYPLKKWVWVSEDTLSLII